MTQEHTVTRCPLWQSRLDPNCPGFSRGLGRNPKSGQPGRAFPLPGFCPDRSLAPSAHLPELRPRAPANRRGRPPEEGGAAGQGRVLPFRANPRPRLPCAGWGKAWAAALLDAAAAGLLLKDELATCWLGCWTRRRWYSESFATKGRPGLCNNLGSGGVSF